MHDPLSHHFRTPSTRAGRADRAAACPGTRLPAGRTPRSPLTPGATAVLLLGLLACSRGPGIARADGAVAADTSAVRSAPAATAATTTSSITPVATPAAPVPAPAAASPSAVPTPPADFRLLEPWLEYKHQARLPALPNEARIFYRHGLLAAQSHAREEALRLLQGAVELDPTFLAARITLLRSQLFTDPAQTLTQFSGLVSLVRRDFTTQWSLVLNAAYLLLNAWMLAIIAAGLLIFLTHNSELRHTLQERLGRWATPASSHTWAWVLLISPFLLGCGIALPVTAGLGLVWPLLRIRERAVWVMLVVSLGAMPFIVGELDRLALPMRTDSPFAAVLPLGDEPWTPESADRIAQLVAANPRDPYARFGSGWMALSRGDAIAAETAFRDVLHRWTEDDRALDNLGTALVQQGRQKEAVAMYERAIARNPKNAIAYFNLSQAYVIDYDFARANPALSRATALDFDHVREYKNQPARNGALNPVPDWLSTRRLWEALRNPGTSGPIALPPAWHNHPEAASATFPVLLVVIAIASMVFGNWLNRKLPLYHCLNCDRVVCRRCAERRKAQAMCAACARVARGAASANFARILLGRQRTRTTRMVRSAQLALALVAPGAGLISARRVWRALALLFLAAGTLTVLPGSTWPYSGRALVGMGFDPWHLDLLVPLAVIYALSLWGHFAEQARIAENLEALAQPVRPRQRPTASAKEDGFSKEVA